VSKNARSAPAASDRPAAASPSFSTSSIGTRAAAAALRNSARSPGDGETTMMRKESSSSAMRSLLERVLYRACDEAQGVGLKC
jgi:hypothetical protein